MHLFNKHAAVLPVHVQRLNSRLLGRSRLFIRASWVCTRLDKINESIVMIKKEI
jgi:hypothetical protein